MEDYKLGPMETRFAELIWCHAPVSSGELVKICQKELEWKKSTTYTIRWYFPCIPVSLFRSTLFCTEQ